MIISADIKFRNKMANVTVILFAKSLMFTYVETSKMQNSSRLSNKTRPLSFP